MNKQLLTVLAIGAILAVLSKPLLKGDFNLGSLTKIFGSGNAEIFPEKPNGDILVAVDPVRTLLKSADSNDKVALARLFREQATLIGLDGNESVIASTADIVRANFLSGKLMHLDMKGKYPGLATALTDAVKKVIEDDTKQLDDATRGKAVAVFNGLSWAANQ